MFVFIWNPTILWFCRVICIGLIFVLLLLYLVGSPWWTFCLLLVLLILTLFLSVLGIPFERARWSLSKTTMQAKEISQFPTFVINMDHRVDRWSAMEQELGSQGMRATRWSAVNGKALSSIELKKIGIDQSLIDKSRGAAGCAASHVSLWKHIAEKKLGWCLILEDDATFHPDFAAIFPQYWSQVPTDTEIVYAGYFTTPDWVKPRKDKVFPAGLLTTHAYFINAAGANELLKLIPIKTDIDVQVANHYNWSPKSIAFNDLCQVKLADGRKIRPRDYRQSHPVDFHGLIYQNREQLGSDIR